MKWLKKIHSFFLYDGLTREDYLAIRADIHETNRKNMVCYTVLMTVIFLALFAATFFVSSIASNRASYGIAFLLMAVLSTVLLTAAKKNPVVSCVVSYVFCTMVFLFCTYIGTYTAQTLLATSFSVALVILPFVTYDIMLRSMIYRLIMCIVFVIVDVHVKDITFVSRDIVNCVSYFLIGTFAAGIYQNTRAQASYLKRNMNEAIEQQMVKIENLSIHSITAMAAAIDAKDKYTNGHSMRVAKYTRMLTAAMGKPKDEQDRIYSIALLHDIGKIGIPDSIINKPSRLTDEEYAVIKTHAQQGYEILRRIDELPDIAIGAKYHHERYDGKGYPEGLSGGDIPEIARIIAVADAYDAMTSNRSYRPVMDQKKVYEEIRNGMGTQFDPKIAGFMLDIILADKDYQLHG